jgi:5-formyltetrahydrofolate cyclo-ligase
MDQQLIPKDLLRKSLVSARENLQGKLACMDGLTQAMRVWLLGRADTAVGAYWPIKGEFDPLPALHRWKEDGELQSLPQPRRIGLPVVNKVSKTLAFHVWYPGCEMEEDAYNIPKPKDTDIIMPTVLFVPCVGFTKQDGRAYRLGYGGGFYDRTLAALLPAPITIGLAFECARCEFEVQSHDMPLDAVLTENGMA